MYNRFRADPINTPTYFAKFWDRYPDLLRGGHPSDPVLSAVMNVTGDISSSGAGYWSARQRWIGNSPINQAPLVLYPAFSKKAEDAREFSGSTRFDINKLFSFDSSEYTPPTKIPPPTSFEDMPRDQTFSGPNATGGTVSVAAPEITVKYGYMFDDRLTPLHWFWVSATGHTTWAIDVWGSSNHRSYDGFGNGRMVGISIGPRSASPGAGARVLTIVGVDNQDIKQSDLPYGAADTVFVTGVFFNDANKTGYYDIGEGVKGATVALSSNDWTAVTATAGGYAVPVKRGSGAVTVTLRHGKTTLTRQVTVGTDNVKADFVLPVKPTQKLVGDSDPKARLLNLSTRGIAESGETALISGFVISDGPGTKRLVIRCVAQSLQQHGLAGVLRKPVLKLYDKDRKLLRTAHTEDTYGPQNPTTKLFPPRADYAELFRSVYAFPLLDNASGGKPNGNFPSGDAVMVVDLPSGLYTVSATPDTDPGFATPNLSIDAEGTSGSSGLVLLEVYDTDLSESAPTRLLNLSTRGKIESGGRRMIVGFYVSGDRRLIVRGVGPTLAEFGVSPAVEDPSLELFDSGGNVLFSNDDWNLATWTDQAAAESGKVYAFPIPRNSLDAAILARVPVGSYTSVITSSTGEAGIAIAEIYEN